MYSTIYFLLYYMTLFHWFSWFRSFCLVVYGVFLFFCFGNLCLIFVALFWSFSSCAVCSVTLYSLVFSYSTWLYYFCTYYHILPGTTWKTRGAHILHGFHGGVILSIFGADSTSSMFKWVQNGYRFEKNAIIFWLVSTHVTLIVSGIPKIVIGLGASGVPIPP